MKTAILAAVASMALGCGAGDPSRPVADTTAARADTASSTAAASAGVQLKLPPGFTARVFAESLGSTPHNPAGPGGVSAETRGRPRHIAAGPGGVIYANTWHSPYDTTRKVPPGGYLIALRDT